MWGILVQPLHPKGVRKVGLLEMDNVVYEFYRKKSSDISPTCLKLPLGYASPYDQHE